MSEVKSPSQIATDIIDKYWKIDSERFPNPYLLEQDIANAILADRQELLSGLRVAVETLSAVHLDSTMFNSKQVEDTLTTLNSLVAKFSVADEKAAN